jgi:hypothetical protein
MSHVILGPVLAMFGNFFGVKTIGVGFREICRKSAFILFAVFADFRLRNIGGPQAGWEEEVLKNYIRE